MSRVSLEPLPETSGLLDEPPRRPPTAVGAATIPPPPDRYSRRLGPTRRIALALLAIVFAMSAVPLVSSASATRTIVAASLAATSADAGLQAASGTVHPWREVVRPPQYASCRVRPRSRTTLLAVEGLHHNGLTIAKQSSARRSER